MTFRIL